MMLGRALGLCWAQLKVSDRDPPPKKKKLYPISHTAYNYNDVGPTAYRVEIILQYSITGWQVGYSNRTRKHLLLYKCFKMLEQNLVWDLVTIWCVKSLRVLSNLCIAFLILTSMLEAQISRPTLHCNILYGSVYQPRLNPLAIGLTYGAIVITPWLPRRLNSAS